MSIKPGDVVRLKSGGPRMTVACAKDSNIITLRHEEGEFLRAEFAPFLLDLVDPSPPVDVRDDRVPEFPAVEEESCEMSGVEAAKARLGERGIGWLAYTHDDVEWIARSDMSGAGGVGEVVRAPSEDASILALDRKLHPPESTVGPPWSAASPPAFAEAAGCVGAVVAAAPAGGGGPGSSPPPSPLRPETDEEVILHGPAPSVTTEHGTFRVGEPAGCMNAEGRLVVGTLVGLDRHRDDRSARIEFAGHPAPFPVRISHLRPVAPPSDARAPADRRRDVREAEAREPGERVRAILVPRGFAGPCIKFITWSLAAKEGLDGYSDVLSPELRADVESAWKGAKP